MEKPQHISTNWYKLYFRSNPFILFDIDKCILLNYSRNADEHKYCFVAF